MASLVAGVVSVDDDGVVSFVPPGATNSIAGAIYTGEIEALDEYTTEQGGTVLPDNERVAALRYYAKRTNKTSARLATYLNANL